MSRSAKSLIKNTLLVLGGIGVIAMAWISLEQILRASPFAGNRLTGTPIGAEVGLSMDQTTMKAYENNRLAVEVAADLVEVRRDRSQMVLTGVKNGKYFPKEGKPFEFDMRTGTYHYFQDRLMAQSGAHVKNADMDLNSDSFQYDKQTGTLLVRGDVQGKLGGGAFKASDFAFVTKGETMSANNVKWIGELDDVPGQTQRREWHIEGDLQPGSTMKVSVFKNAVATDGETIVRADLVERTKETEVLVAKGNVKYFGLDANLLCNEATVYQKERRAVFVGAVHMVVKAKDDDKVVESEFPTIERVEPESLTTNPQGATEEQVKVLRDPDNVRSYPIKVIADKVEYWYKKGERHAVIEGSPFARQDIPEGWRLGKSPQALYDGEKETLTLLGSKEKREVAVYSSIGDRYFAFVLVLGTKEGDDSISGEGVRISGFFDDDEIPTRGGGGGATTGGGTGR